MSILNRLKLSEVSGSENLNDLELSKLHLEIIKKKGFLKKIYLDFYSQLADSVKYAENQSILELGSGGGFIKEVYPDIITSDVLELPTVDKIFSACQMPFEDGSLDAIMMIDVLHHIPDVRAFFREATRCLKPGGRMAMIEPANTLWARFIYQHFHHEDFDPKAEWEFPSSGPLSTANGALPWIVFHRDRAIFQQEFPKLKILTCQCHTPLRYLISGGLTLKQLVPSWCYSAIKGLEFCLTPLNRLIGMFQTIVLERIN